MYLKYQIRVLFLENKNGRCLNVIIYYIIRLLRQMHQCVAGGGGASFM